MAITNNLALTLLDQAQAQKEVTINEALVRVDAVLNAGAINRTTNTPPGSPAAGDLYIVGSAPTGAWAGKALQITYYDQVWRFVVPKTGMTLWVSAEAKHYVYNGTSWIALSYGDLSGPASATDNAVVRFDTTTGKLVQNSSVTIDDNGTITSAQSVTGSQSTDGIFLNPTWNTTGAPKAIEVSVTNTASGTASRLMDLLVGGTSQCNVTMAGIVNSNGFRVGATGTPTVNIVSNIIALNSASSLRWTSSTDATGTGDVFLHRDAAATLAQRNGTAAQTFRVYGTYTDASNGDWLNFTKNAGGTATITTAANGTGTAGALALNVPFTAQSVVIQNNSVTRLSVSNLTYTFTPGAGASTSARFGYTASADTGITASTEAVVVDWNLSATRQHLTGALTLQRDMRVRGSTHSFVAASTLTELATLSVEYGNAGTNATITHLSALYVPTAALSNTTNGYGLDIEAPSGATNNYAAYLNGPVRFKEYTVATLPTVAAYTRAFVTDANATTFHSIVAGGGANIVPVFYDGTNWRIG